MATERTEDIPTSELQDLVDDYKLEGWSVKKTEQGNGLWTVVAKSPKNQTAAPTAPATKNSTPSTKPAIVSISSTSNKGWRVAASLTTLLHQVNKLAPNRSKKSDGTIGDAKHQTSKSDHNPHVKDGNQGVVTALDITHDRTNGCDCQKIIDSLIASKDSRIKYIIWKKKIVSSKIKPWVWRKYSGSNPHNRHLHISVMGSKSKYDSLKPWNLFEMGKSRASSSQEIAWGSEVSKAFKNKVIKIAAGLQVDPSDLMAVMAFESNRTFSPKIQNQRTKATGLI